MRRVAAFIIRASSFVQKELAEIIRQTRLLLALVLGPFLILLLFGIGYRNEARVLKTLFVVPQDETQIRQQVQQYATTLGPQINFQGITTDKGQALAQLAQGKVDAVAVMPDQVEQKIRNSEQPVIQLYHREIDPFQASYVEYVAQIYVDEVNRRVLQNMVEQGQKESGNEQKDLETAKASAHAMRLAYEAGNGSEAKNQHQKMNQSMDAVSLGLGATLGVLQGVEQTSGTGSGQASDIQKLLNDYQTNSDSLNNSPTDQSNYSAEAQKAAQIENDLNKLDTQLKDFRQIDSRVLVSPFKGEAVNVNNLKLTSSDFFSPGVIVLLLQHLLITFAALSIVRERTSGALELFRVAPVSAFETLLGKYIAYLFIGVLLATLITALVVIVLGVPMLGSWQNLALVLLAVMFASLGIGFVISLVSETTSQAVQYSMLLLLMSIFFTGFFLDLRLMANSIRFIAWILPATYGMRMVQEIMFRSNPINPLLMAGLLGIGLLMYIISWILLARQMRTR